MRNAGFSDGQPEAQTICKYCNNPKWQPAYFMPEVPPNGMWWHRNLAEDIAMPCQAPHTGEQLKVASKERKDCSKALLALAGWFPTPEEGYGYNTSWAISDLCRAIEQLRAARPQEQTSQPAEAQDKLRDLVAKWRQLSAESHSTIPLTTYTQDQPCCHSLCADELEQLLSRTTKEPE
jgi:hypothetical protein